MAADFKFFSSGERKSFKIEGVTPKKASGLLDMIEENVGLTCDNDLKKLIRDILPKDLEREVKSLYTNHVKATLSAYSSEKELGDATKPTAEAAQKLFTDAMGRVHKELTPDLDQRLLHILKMARTSSDWAWEEMSGQTSLAITGMDGSKQFFMLKPEELVSIKEHIKPAGSAKR